MKFYLQDMIGAQTFFFFVLVKDETFQRVQFHLLFI